jgi:hypothetical protein
MQNISQAILYILLKYKNSEGAKKIVLRSLINYVNVGVIVGSLSF